MRHAQLAARNKRKRRTSAEAAVASVSAVLKCLYAQRDCLEVAIRHLESVERIRAARCGLFFHSTDSRII